MVTQIKKVDLNYKKQTFKERQMEPNFKTPVPKSLSEKDEEVINTLNINDYISDKDGLSKSLEDLGIAERYAENAKIIDDNHLSIKFDNGVDCTYEVSPEGELKPITAFAKDENGNLIYESSNGVSTYYNSDGSTKLTEIFNDKNQLKTKINYENGYQSQRTNYSYNEDGSITTIEEININNNTIKETNYNGEKGNEYPTTATEKDSNGNILKVWKWDYDKSELSITDYDLGRKETRKYINSEVYETAEIRDIETNGIIEKQYYDNDGSLEKTDYYDSEGNVINTITSASIKRQEIVDEALKYVGILPYVWGGESLTTGADCSGFVKALYKDLFGIELYHGTNEVYYDNSVGEQIEYSRSNLKPGDLIYCSSKSDSNSWGHVVMYIGDGKTIEEPSSGRMVEIHDLDYLEGWATINGVKRILTD